MKLSSLATTVVSLGVSILNLSAIASPGLSTRDLNPILQPIYLPSYTNLAADDGWRINHSFYITNTLQQQTRGTESLIIDVENYRYDLAIGLRKQNWVMQANLPFIANDSGQLDGLIENWHDLFGLPQGNRDNFAQHQLEIEYIRDGVSEYSQTGSSSGLGDIAIAIGYHPAGATGYFFGLELPTGSESDFSGNEAIDFAFWILNHRPINEVTAVYGLFGISFPGDDGALEGLIVNRIWVAQLGLDYRFTHDIIGIAQLDLHSKTIEDSNLKALGNSLQLQLGLGFENLIEDHRLELFFSEDIQIGTAPDISFGVRLARDF